MTKPICSFFVVALVAAGCSRATPTFTNSKFLSELKLRALAEKRVATKDLKPSWGSIGADRSESGGSATGQRVINQDFHGTFYYRDKGGKMVACRPPDSDRFLRAIKDDLEEAIAGSGGRVVYRQVTAKKELLQGFQLDYEAGNARGTITANCEPDRESAHNTNLSIRLKEVITPDP